VYVGLPGVRLAAVCDVEPAARLGLHPGIRDVPFFQESHQLLECCDLVSIATPTSTHRTVATPFLERGVPVLLEKPISSSLPDALTLVEAAEKHGTLFQVGHIEEFNPVVEACLPYVGPIRFIEAHRMSGFSGRSLDTDVVCDLMIHDLDLVLSWIDSDVAHVHAVGVPVLSRQIDLASARLEFANGSVANFTASRVSFTAQRRMRLFTLDRYVRMDFTARNAEFAERVVHPEGSVSLNLKPIAVSDQEPLKRELESFVGCVLHGSPPRVGGRRALRALELALLIRQQAVEHAASWEPFPAGSPHPNPSPADAGEGLSD
jgi:predicted dehydrogenase